MVSKTEWTAEEIADVLAPVFEQNQFKWCREEGMIVPTREDIIAHIKRSVKLLHEKNYYSTSSGRIGVRREDGESIVSLEFFLG